MEEHSDQDSWSPELRVRGVDALATEVDGELVLLHPESDTYFGLNETGALIWEWLEEPRELGELQRRLADHYELGEDRARSAVQAFLTDLRREGLIETLEPTSEDS